VDAGDQGGRRVGDRRAGVDAVWVVKRGEEVGASDDGEQRQHGRRYDLECAKAKAQEHQNTGDPLFTLERAACALKASGIRSIEGTASSSPLALPVQQLSSVLSGPSVFARSSLAR
jgi:hypothetical protein